MSYVHTITTSYATGIEGQLTSSAIAVTSDSERNYDGAIPGSATANYEIDWAITAANLKSLLILSTIAITIYTNDKSTGSPQDTIAIAAGVGFCWNGGTNPFAGNVTKLYITAGAAPAGALKIRCLLHQAT